MSDLLSIGATGLRAYQTALTTVSENIANAGTAGYARRTTELREVAAGTSVGTGTVNGVGVVVGGVARAGDALRAAEVRNAGADLARTEAGSVWLQRIESALTGNALGERLTAFFASAQAIAADPTALAPRSAMLEAATGAAVAFTGTGEALAGAVGDLDARADNAVAQLNGLAAGLARVNAGLGRAVPGTSGSAALLDQRDRLLEQMSAITDVDARFDAAGRVTLRGGAGGPVLVQGDSAAVVTYVRNAEGAVSFAAYRDGATQVLTPGGGALAGLAEGAQRLVEAQAALDDLATRFAEGVNAFQASGAALDGTAGQAIFATGDVPTALTVTLADPRGIAAAAAGEGARGNGNLAALATLRTTGGFEDGLTALITANANALASRAMVASAQGAIRDNAVAARDAASAVNIDEEAVDLIRFQQAYQASSRVIQVARDVLDALFAIR